MKKILLSSMIVVAVAAVAGFTTYSYFSDTATSTQNTFSSGVLSINDGKIATAAVSLPNMAPGDVTGEYSVVIENNGNMNLGWLGDWQFDGGLSGDHNYDLKDALYIADAKMEFLTSNPSVVTWNSDATAGYDYISGYKTDHFITNGVGSGPYGSAYTAIANQSPFEVVTFNKFSLPANSGMLPGTVYEHEGALKPGYSYRLTVKFGLAPLAGNQYQNLGPVTAKLQVNATQINAAALEAQGVPAGSAPGTVTWMNAQIADQTE